MFLRLGIKSCHKNHRKANYSTQLRRTLGCFWLVGFHWFFRSLWNLIAAVSRVLIAVGIGICIPALRLVLISLRRWGWSFRSCWLGWCWFWFRHYRSTEPVHANRLGKDNYQVRYHWAKRQLTRDKQPNSKKTTLALLQKGSKRLYK